MAFKVPIFGAYLYDAVFLYARAATEVLAARGDLYNGTLIMEHILGRAYTSVQGFDVREIRVKYNTICISLIA